MEVLAHTPLKVCLLKMCFRRFQAFFQLQKVGQVMLNLDFVLEAFPQSLYSVCVHIIYNVVICYYSGTSDSGPSKIGTQYNGPLSTKDKGQKFVSL